MMNQAPQPELLRVQGTITSYEKKTTNDGARIFYRIAVTDQQNQQLFMSSFKDQPNEILAKLSQGSIVEVSYTKTLSPDGKYTNVNVQSVTVHQQAEPVASPDWQVEQPAPNNTVAGVGQVVGLPSDGYAVNLDTTGRSIIRQVAFKQAVASEGTNGGQSFDNINAMTNIYEQIILGLYAPEADEEFPDGSYIQQAF